MFALFLTGCKVNGVKVGWRETSGLSHKTAQYVSFDGTDEAKICVEAGQTISLDYEVTVSKGALTVSLNRPDGMSVWQETFSQNAADTVTVATTDKGCYPLQFVGERAAGSLDFLWEISD